MNATAFALDARLAADTVPVASLPLCHVLLMDDARFPWLVLVPRRAGKVEIVDLDAQDQAQVWREVNQASLALRACGPCDKLNIGALGNIVRQLHIHVVARRAGDDAWPGPVWGCGTSTPYQEQARSTLVERLRHDVSR